MRKVLGILILALSGFAVSDIGYGSVGYGPTGYSSIGYGEEVQDTLSVLEEILAESARIDTVADSVSDEDAFLPRSDGSLGYRAALQNSWLNFADNSNDQVFLDFTGIGFSFGGSKSFGHGGMFEFIPGMDLDLRVFWGNYKYRFSDDTFEGVRSRLGAMLSIDLRTTFMFRVNVSLFYLEAGPQIGFNLLQTSMVEYDEVFGYPQEDLGMFIFALVPGGGVRFKNVDIGVRFIPDITNCWKRSKASMVSTQFAITFWQ